MTRYIHNLSAVLFYSLGVSYMVAYVLHFNTLGGFWPAWWMEIADLPFAVVAMLYGGSSLYLSIVKPGQKSYVLAGLIVLPLMLLFSFLFVLNYWDVFFKN